MAFRGLIYTSGGLFTVFLALSAYLAFQLISDDPLVVKTGNISPQATLSLKNNIKQVIGELASGKNGREIMLRHQELKELSAILSHGVPSLSATYNYSVLQLLLAGKLELPANPAGEYLNISTVFSDSGNLFSGFTWIGRLQFDNDFLLGFSFLAGSFVFDKNFVSEIQYILKSISFSNQGLLLILDRPINIKPLKAEIKQNLFRLRNVV